MPTPPSSHECGTARDERAYERLFLPYALAI
jgi:hypothetical protein